MLDPDHFDWVCYGLNNEKITNPCTLKSAQGYSSNWTVNGFPIEYCLSKVIHELCQLQFNIYVLLVVSICNLLKR
jgi:hypothetical protein